MSKLTRPALLLPIAILGAGNWACGSSADEPTEGVEQAGSVAVSGGAGGKAATAGKGTSTAGAKSPSAGRGGAAAGGREVTIRFRAKVGERAFACGQRYDNLGSARTSVDPADFRFFVQDLSLIDKSGKAVPVSIKVRSPWQDTQVALLDFEDQSGSCGQGSAATNDVIEGNVPAGEYAGVEFTNGVPEDLNHIDPVTGPAPLQLDAALSWGWLTGFKFFIAEVHQTMDPSAKDADGGVVPGGAGLLHVGSTACKANEGCLHANRNRVRLMDFNPDKDVIVADFGNVFSNTDLSHDSQCHSSGMACSALFKQVGLDFQSGEQLSTQSVYRVEPRGAGK
jgi:uncharacterized repeat protein (TIGR04052 family)